MIKLPQSEFTNRIEKLGELMDEKKLDAIYISNTTTFKYLADYYYIQTERPAAMLMDKNLDIHFFGPVMEKEHVLMQCPLIKDSLTYPDYPGEKHPLVYFAEWIKEFVKEGSLGTDNMNLYPGYWGFEPSFTMHSLSGIKLFNISKDIFEMRKIKSKNEQEIMRESSKWGNLAHSLLQKYTAPGLFDFDIESRASSQANLAAMYAFGRDFSPPINFPLSIHAGFRGQVGEHSYYPHSLSVNRVIKKGDVLGSGANGNIDGYHIEIERNLFVGEPSNEAKKFHKIAVDMQSAAIKSIKLGMSLNEIDKAVIKFAKEHDVLKYRLHHSGHCIGLEGHEAPFLDVGESSKLLDGMAFSVEPGVYVPNLGGFRHSDTVIMHADGPEIITYYPSETEALTIY
ncbi:MAG: Xaa-Pro peptidase family protein [Thermoplasmatales archaeon]